MVFRSIGSTRALRSLGGGMLLKRGGKRERGTPARGLGGMCLFAVVVDCPECHVTFRFTLRQGIPYLLRRHGPRAPLIHSSLKFEYYPM